MKRVFLLAFLFVVFSVGAYSQKTYALVCGVSKYDDPTGSCVNLTYPAKGAKTIKKVYTKAGFITALLTSQHVTESNIMEKLNAIIKIAKPEDRIIFQFIGHGSTGNIHLYQGTAFSYTELMSTLSKARTDKIFCIIDACQSGSAIKIADSNYKELEGAKPAFVMACRPNESTVETCVLASPVFTLALAKGLRGHADANNDKKVTLMELFRYVHSDMVNRGNSLGISLHPQLLGSNNLFHTVLTVVK